MKIKIITWLFFSMQFSFHVSGQNADSIINKLNYYMYAVDNFTQQVPQEKVYLHFDNTGYYQNDNIWFKCYVESSNLHPEISMSKTLYVELLNTGGEVIDKRILKIEDGQCHGDFTLNRLPFYSGFYEVRAYTKYMLNFGEDAIFSRLLPVFDKPKEAGYFDEKKMGRYNYWKYPTERKKPQKGKKVNLKFFPEGGNPVQGIESRVAFEATDEYGYPLEVTGTIINKEKDEISRFSVTHEGKGVFVYTPGDDNFKAVVDYAGKEYQFDMPKALSQGVVLKIDNLSDSDSIGITLRKNKHTPDYMVGLAVIGKCKLQHGCFITIPDDEMVHYKIDKTMFSSGVSRIVVFDMNGEILCDRLVFINKNDEFLDIKVKTEKESYTPNELVNMEFSVTDKEENPVSAGFSLSIRDGMDEIEHKHNILTYFLLMSEIKGYVRNPSYYFESDDETRHTNLDLLMMVQGWRRNVWKQMTGTEPFDLKFIPEQGIETHGRVVSLGRSIPKPDVDVFLFLNKKEEENSLVLIETFVTDSLGRFAFVLDEYEKWDMVLSVEEKRKKKDHRIILDRLFPPAPRRYESFEMRADIADVDDLSSIHEKILDIPDWDMDSVRIAFLDSLDEINQKIHIIPEITVKAKKGSKENDIYRNRSKSIAYYDVPSELDDIKDRGKYIGGDIHQLLMSMNERFIYIPQGDYLIYKGKLPLIVINYERTNAGYMDYTKYKLIRLEAIKSIYINEDITIKSLYADPRLTPIKVDQLYSCVVFIETYPDGTVPTEAGKGVRKTKLEGYSYSREFYNPDYSQLLPESDYRRTLYWNPAVTPDEDGKAHIQFFNNSRCRNFSISAETMTSQGLIGVYKNE